LRVNGACSQMAGDLTLRNLFRGQRRNTGKHQSSPGQKRKPGAVQRLPKQSA
jgi:hypothetical protein